MEREIAEQIRRIQRYFYKLNNNLGTVETATKHLKDAFRIIDELLQEGSIGSPNNHTMTLASIIKIALALAMIFIPAWAISEDYKKED